MGGVLDGSQGSGARNGWLASFGPDTPGEEQRCVRNSAIPVVKMSLIISKGVLSEEIIF